MGTYTSLDAARKEIEAKLAEVRNRLVIEAFNKLVTDSPLGNPILWSRPPPLGYTPGHFRANWQGSINTIPNREVDSTSLIPRAQHLTYAKLKDTLYIANRVEYAGPLALGWSSQQPNGWIEAIVEKSLADINKHIKIAEKG